jgi:hypothetical protein
VDSSHLDGLEWRRSSRCDAGACVEVAKLDAMIMIRDSAEPDSSVAISYDIWRGFVSKVQAGLFDAC